jgi:hypothetical protein
MSERKGCFDKKLHMGEATCDRVQSPALLSFPRHPKRAYTAAGDLRMSKMQNKAIGLIAPTAFSRLHRCSWDRF